MFPNEFPCPQGAETFGDEIALARHVMEKHPGGYAHGFFPVAEVERVAKPSSYSHPKKACTPAQALRHVRQTQTRPQGKQLKVPTPAQAPSKIPDPRIKKRWETRQRRKKQRVKVYELKLTRSKMSKKVREYLMLLFLEAKWFYNYVISQQDPFKVDTKVKSVPVKMGDTFEERALIHLSSQMKQGIVTRIQDSIKALASKKTKGMKVGRLKFKSRIRSIPLKQYGVTYELFRTGTTSNRRKNNGHLKLQKPKTRIRLCGLAQIPEQVEYANALLQTRHGDYFLKVVTYQPKDKVVTSNKAIVIDVGLTSQLTFSNAVSVKYGVPVAAKLRALYKKWSRTKKGSRNRERARLRLEKEFSHLRNIKKDIQNKIISYLSHQYQVICFQDENLKAWTGVWGRKMYDISLGGLIRLLKERIHTPIEVDRFFASTQICSHCGSTQHLGLAERMYHCPNCGLTLDRDHNSALNIHQEGLKCPRAPQIRR